MNLEVVFALVGVFNLGIIIMNMLTGVGTGLAWLATLKMLAIAAPGGRAGAYQAFFAGAFSIGSILAFVNLLGNLGAVAFTLMFGWSKDALGSFAWGFAALSPLAAVALGAGWRSLGKSGPSHN